MSEVETSDPTLTRRDVKSTLLQGFWSVLEQRTDKPTVSAIIAETGLPEAVARDVSGWLSYSYYDQLNRVVAKRLYGLDELPALDHELWQMWRQAPPLALGAMGATVSMLRAFASTESVYQAQPTMTQLGNSGIDVAHIALGPGAARFELRAKPGSPPVGPATVWKIFGWVEALPTIWGLPKATVTMEVVPEAGGPAYCYQVSYQHGSVQSRLALLVAVAGAGIGVIAAPHLGMNHLYGAIGGAACTLAVTGWYRLYVAGKQAEVDGKRLRDLIERTDERYASERRALLTSRQLSGYLALDLVQDILKDPDSERRLGGRSIHAAVLFSDIVAFTPRCEARTPEQVVEELNVYFSHVDPVFSRHGGVIDKRIGDGMMVVFTGRGEESDTTMCHQAIGAALEAIQAVDACNTELKARGAPPFQIRVGLAFGPLIQGNMGSTERLEYTVIGDTVNLAARLEGRASPGRVLVTAATYAHALGGGALPGVVAGETELIVKGKLEPIRVVELAPVSGA